MAETAFGAALEVAGGSLFYVLNNAVQSVTIMKDTTAEEYFATVNGIFSDNAGHGPHVNRHIQHLL